MGRVSETRVLVVDDESNITDLVATALRYEGFDVEVASTGTDALRAAESFRPDLMVLDIMLPDRNGFQVVQRLRADGRHVPVVFLTARDSTEEKVKGLTVGGDDYVTKPFSLEELVARVPAVLRRTGATNGESSARLVFADLELDDDTHEVWRGRTRIELTPTEYKLLRYLMLNARTRPVEVADPRSRVGVRLRRRRQCRRDVHQLPAQEDRPPRPTAHSHHPRRRLHVAHTTGELTS